MAGGRQVRWDRWLAILSAIAGIGLVIALATGTLSLKSGDEVGAQDPLASRSRGLLDSLVSALSENASSSDGEYSAGGRWHTTVPGCWPCDLAPGTAAALLARLDGSSAMRTLAISTFDTAIADRQRADGGFGAPPSLDIQTMTFGNELGSAYLELESVLPAATKVRWQGAIAAAADYLVTNRNITWYTNGNINLGNTELFYLAWRATGDERYRLDYEQALSFTISPPQDRWSGYGLRILHQPTWADGADGTGYLAEAGTGGIGYDPEYTMLQLDVATRLYMQSGDSRILRLVNLFTNVLLPRVDASWMLDTSGGTRHTEQGRKVPFVTAALQVLATIGGRPELSPLASSQFGRVETEYSQAIGHVWPNISRGVAQQIAVDVQTTHPLANVSRTLLASKRVHRRQ